MREEKDVSWRRSVGFVAKIRLSPRDVMSCIDCVNAVHAEMQGMSLSATIKRGIAIALETLRASKVLPERDGFEYNDMIETYSGISKVEKIAAGHKMVMQDQRNEQMDVRTSAIMRESRYEPTKEEIIRGNKRKRLDRQRTELLFKKKADPDNWTRAEQKRLEGIEEEIVL